MDTTLADSPRELVLGIGVGVISLLLGLALIGVAVTDRVPLLDHPAVAGVLLGFAFAFAVVGLYEIVARGVPKRGVADLTAAAGITLSLLGPYGQSARAFVALGAIALLGAGVYHAALEAEVSEEPAVDVDNEESV
jgi:hypothetical protein